MNPTDFPQANHTWAKPADLTDEQCRGLRAFRGLDPDGFPVSISRWEPTPEERARLAAGGPVWLWIFGLGHPVVSLSGEAPWPEEARTAAPAAAELRREEPARAAAPPPSAPFEVFEAAIAEAKRTGGPVEVDLLDGATGDRFVLVVEPWRPPDATAPLKPWAGPGPDPILDLGDEGDAPGPEIEIGPLPPHLKGCTPAGCAPGCAWRGEDSAVVIARARAPLPPGPAGGGLSADRIRADGGAPEARAAVRPEGNGRFA
jgi:hypothetical protein